MLQGVLARGTARVVKHLCPMSAARLVPLIIRADAWFVGFTNDVTIAIWVGYDNGDGGRRTLGHGQTGGKVALPMFEPIVQAAWELHAPKTALKGPSREAMRQLVALSIDPHTGDPAPAGSGRAFTEYLKRDPSGQINDTQFRIVSRAERYAYRGGYDEDDGPFQLRSRDYRHYGDNRPPIPFPTWRLGPREYPSWRGHPDDEDRLPRPPLRIRSRLFLAAAELSIDAMRSPVPLSSSPPAWPLARARPRRNSSWRTCPQPPVSDRTDQAAHGHLRRPTQRQARQFLDPAHSFDDWARSHPVQRRFLSLFPGFVEPALNQQTKLKLSVYQAEARFRLPRPAAALDISRYANVAFLEQIDPAVKHRPITAGDAVPNTDAAAAHNRPPDRRWCEDAKAICVQSRYMFEGKIPAGTRCQRAPRGEQKAHSGFHRVPE